MHVIFIVLVIVLLDSLIVLFRFWVLGNQSLGMNYTYKSISMYCLVAVKSFNDFLLLLIIANVNILLSFSSLLSSCFAPVFCVQPATSLGVQSLGTWGLGSPKTLNKKEPFFKKFLACFSASQTRLTQDWNSMLTSLFFTQSRKSVQMDKGNKKFKAK